MTAHSPASLRFVRISLVAVSIRVRQSRPFLAKRAPVVFHLLRNGTSFNEGSMRIYVKDKCVFRKALVNDDEHDPARLGFA